MAKYTAKYSSPRECLRLSELRKYGVNFGPLRTKEPITDTGSMMFASYEGEIDTAELRKGHDIFLFLNDISSEQELSFNTKADLILFNHCAAYLRPNLALKGLTKLVGRNEKRHHT